MSFFLFYYLVRTTFFLFRRSIFLFYYLVRTTFFPYNPTSHIKRRALSPVHSREPINPALSRSVKMDGSAMSGPWSGRSSVCWSKVQRGLVGPALRGRGERDQFFNRSKNGRRWSRSPLGVCWAGVQRGRRRYSVGLSYLDRVWSAIQRRKVGVERIKITCFDWRAGN